MISIFLRKVVAKSSARKAESGAMLLSIAFRQLKRDYFACPRISKTSRVKDLLLRRVILNLLRFGFDTSDLR